MKKLQICRFFQKNFSVKNKIEINRYIKEVEKSLNHISDTIERKELEITENLVLSDGVLKITFTGNKNYVLNIQRPNLQIWLSSPFSGPQRFEYDLTSNTWKNNRSGKDLYLILEEEINQILKENKISDEINFIETCRH
jgi:frataxin